MGCPTVQFDDQVEFLVQDVAVCTSGSELRNRLVLALGKCVRSLDVADIPVLEHGVNPGQVRIEYESEVIAPANVAGVGRIYAGVHALPPALIQSCRDQVLAQARR
jgi:hypothetical protein